MSIKSSLTPLFTSNFAAVGIGMRADKISRGLTPELQMAVLAGSKYVERQVDSMYRGGVSNDHLQRQQEWREQVRRELESMRR